MKKVLSVLIMLFSILLLGILVGCYHDNHIISRKEKKAYTVAELKEMYDVYHDDFNDVAKIVLKNDPMKQAMINTNEGVASFETTSVKDFLRKMNGTLLRDYSMKPAYLGLNGVAKVPQKMIQLNSSMEFQSLQQYYIIVRQIMSLIWTTSDKIVNSLRRSRAIGGLDIKIYQAYFKHKGTVLLC